MDGLLAAGIGGTSQIPHPVMRHKTLRVEGDGPAGQMRSLSGRFSNVQRGPEFLQ